MKRTKLKTMLLFLLIACHTSIFSQDKEFLRHEFSIHTGYGTMINSVAGLTLSTQGYKRDLSQGVSWDGQYHFRIIQRFAVGLTYSGFSSKGSHAEGSDHLFINYIAPQISVCNLSSKSFQFRLGAGVGGIYFRDNSKVFGKPRRVKGNTFGAHINLTTAYKLTEHLGVGLEAQYIAGELDKINSHYHDETIIVRFKDNNKANLSRLNIVAGLSYYF